MGFVRLLDKIFDWLDKHASRIGVIFVILTAPLMLIIIVCSWLFLINTILNQVFSK